MRKFFTILVLTLVTTLVSFSFISCESKRPDAGSFEYSLSISSIQANAQVEIMDGSKSVASGVTDAEGKLEFSSLKAVSELKIKVCGGSVTLVSSADPVDWTGCNEIMFTPVEKETNAVVVDFLSTLIKNYDSETATEEWMSYLDVTTLPHPALQTSLTDATKRYLWLQGFAVIAKNISQANGVTPESQYSTEKLIDLIKEDLLDDNVINGSTSAVFGTLNINASLMKSVIAEAIPNVSEDYNETDLKDWTDKISSSETAFLGGSGGEEDTKDPTYEIVSPESLSYWYNTAFEIHASDEKGIKYINCTVENVGGEAEPFDVVDTDEKPDVFRAMSNDYELLDGTVRLSCDISDGTNIVKVDIDSTKDSIHPDVNIDLIGQTYVTTTSIVEYTVEELNPDQTMFAIMKGTEEPKEDDWNSTSNPLSGSITFTNDLIEEDGGYTLYVRSIDLAGNGSTSQRSIIFDTEIPESEVIVTPEINEFGFIAQDSVSVRIVASDNITEDADIVYESFIEYDWVANETEDPGLWNYNELNDTLHEFKFRLKDQAGNMKDGIIVSFTVDTETPLMNTNATALELHAYNSSDESLELFSTCQDSNNWSSPKKHKHKI